MNHGTHWAYKRHKCRCDVCVTHHNDHQNDYKRRKREAVGSNAYGRIDDGIVDEVVVDRLLAGTLHWLDATPTERYEAGRIAMRREGGYAFCAEVLHLGPRAIRRLRGESTFRDLLDHIEAARDTKEHA